MRRVSSARLSVAFLVTTVLAAACACRQAQAPSESRIRVEVYNVDFDPAVGAPVVLLEDQETERALPIWIGENEARAIMLELRGIRPERPLTVDLLRRTIKETGHEVDSIVVSELRGTTYYADIYMDHGRYRIDSRPSDAIALALGVKAPIYVAASLFSSEDTVSLAGRGRVPKVVHELGATVQNLTSEMAGYFNAEPGRGVLVSDAEGGAAQAGLQRGDVIVAIGSRNISSIKDFVSAISGLPKDRAVMIGVTRNAQKLTLTIRPPLGIGEQP